MLCLLSTLSRWVSSMKTWTAVCCLLSLASCAPYHEINESNIDATLDAFKAGRIELGSPFSHTENFVHQKPLMGALYYASDWVSLSKLVIEVDSDNDLDWFYLGRSAEAAGFTMAAKHYYTRALATIYKCGGASYANSCNGLYFPQDIFRRLDRL